MGFAVMVFAVSAVTAIGETGPTISVRMAVKSCRVDDDEMIDWAEPGIWLLSEEASAEFSDRRFSAIKLS